MKVAIDTNKYLASIQDLIDIDFNVLTTGDIRCINGKVYKYFESSDNGIKPDNLSIESRGRWVRQLDINSYYELVDDGYDFITNNKTDVTSITLFNFIGQELGLDWQQVQHQIRVICATTGFASLSQSEKDLVGVYGATDDTTLVTHYVMTHTAGDQAAALNIHSTNIGNMVSKLSIIASKRYEDPRTIKVVMTYLKDRSQIDLFIAAIRNYIADFISKFHLGTEYGDSTDGIMNYVENSGTSYSAAGTGLDSYEFSDIYKQEWYNSNAVDPQNPTQVEQDFAHAYVRDLLKTKLVNILYYGTFE